MEFGEVIRRRRMVRNFRSDPVPREVLGRILDTARKAPSAGFSQGVELLVLEGVDATERFWARSFPLATRDDFRWPGLLDAPVLITPLAHAQAYLDRYSEPDKVASGLGSGEDAWPVPYWLTDAAMAAENILLAATDEGLGALFFGLFHGETEVMSEFGVPDTHKPIGSIAVGYPAPDVPGRSIARGRRALDEMVHWGSW